MMTGSPPDNVTVFANDQSARLGDFSRKKKCPELATEIVCPVTFSFPRTP